MAEYSNQKISAMLKKMLDNNTVVKVVDKKKSYNHSHTQAPPNRNEQVIKSSLLY